MIEEILPGHVATAEAFSDPPGAWLFPEEEAAIARAVGRRRAEFTTARHCARVALAKLGLPPAPIVPGTSGSPCWPPGIVGSITHCSDYRACAVALSEKIVALGVDAEPHQALPAGVLRQITTLEERAHLLRLRALRPEVHWDRLLFSAKETVYKAWFPLTWRWLDFGEAVIGFQPATGTFTARLEVPGPVLADHNVSGFTGRWLVREGLLLTAVAVPLADAAVRTLP